MLLRTRIRLFATLTVACLSAFGCKTEQNHAGGLPAFSWTNHANVPKSRKDLKDPSHLDLSYAQWQEQLGNLPEAEQSYRRVLKQDPRSVDALIGLARLEQLAGRAESAEQAYQAAVKAVPGDAQALDALGQFYAAEKRWNEAAGALALATKAAPNDTTYRHHYAVALARKGETGQAIAEFTRTVGEAEAHYNVGYVFYEQGRTELAEREFLQAVMLRPDLDAAQTMLDEIHRGRDEAGLLAGDLVPQGSALRQTGAVAPAANRRAVVPADSFVRTSGPSRRVAPAAGQGAAAMIQAEQMRNQVGTQPARR